MQLLTCGCYFLNIKLMFSILTIGGLSFDSRSRILMEKASSTFCGFKFMLIVLKMKEANQFAQR